MKPDDQRVRETALEAIGQYPPPLRGTELAHLERYCFHVGLVWREQGHLVDLGAGIGAFPLICASLGMRVAIVDDFRDPVNQTRAGKEVLRLHQAAGINVICANVLEYPFRLPPSVDCVSCFDLMEHLRDSPKRLFSAAAQALEAGGRLVLSAPNAVSLLKRWRVVLGRTNYGSWENYYHSNTPFRGHVREPVLGEMLDVIRTHHLELVGVFGRNWIPARGRSSIVSRLASAVVQAAPQWCSTIYVVGRKRWPLCPAHDGGP